MTLSSCASAIALIWSQSGQFPQRLAYHQVGCENGFCVGSDHINDLCGIDLVSVGFNVDEDGNDS